MNPALLSSASEEWGTPQELFDSLNRKFCFTLDPCATKENAKCKKFYTKEDDGLSKTWTGRVFMNPPYGRGMAPWVKKAYESVQSGDADLVVCLLPARTDTRLWHEYCVKGDVRFLKGRVTFIGYKDGKLVEAPAPFPSALVLFWKE